MSTVLATAIVIAAGIVLSAIYHLVHRPTEEERKITRLREGAPRHEPPN